MKYSHKAKIKPFIILLTFTAVVIISYLFDFHSNSVKSIDVIVEMVKDGDTIVVRSLSDDRNFTCRLYGIDTPELEEKNRQGQPYSIEARNELKRLIYKKKVKVFLTGEKSYKREICFVEEKGISANLEMVKRGYAWAYREYLDSPHASEYIDAEQRARTKGIGLWRQKNPQPPWEFRRIHTWR